MNLELSPEELAEWERRTSPERPELEALEDPIWRVANLYQCLTEKGEIVHYVPTPEQRLVIWCILVRGWQRLVIPKARQLGMSLTLAILCVDGLAFQAGFKAALVDKTAPDAEKKMREKIQFAWDRLPEVLKEQLAEKHRSTKLLSVWEPKTEAAESSFEAGINFRGGTVEFLWISEWGAIQDTDRFRSREIQAGALPAVERSANGVCVIETTWKGGLDGELGPIIKEALNTREEDKGPRSWRILFFGWQTCPLYRQSHGYIDQESAKYFAKVETYGVLLDHEQKLWYAEKRRTSKSVRDVMQEYPTIVHECWENVPQGSIYGEYIEAARAQGRIVDFLPDRNTPVDTFWDIGLPINTVCWLIQITPQEIRVLDCIMEEDITMIDRVAKLNAMGHPLRHHYFPHDAGTAQALGEPQIVGFTRILGPGCRIVPAVPRTTHGIEMLQNIFPRLVFHATKCAKALEMLGRYRSERETSTGIARDEPVHDRYSHGADALRQMAQALNGGLVPKSHVVGAHIQIDRPRPRAILAGSGLRR